LTEPVEPPVVDAPTLLSDVTPDELARALGLNAPTAPGPVADRLALAIATAEDVVAHYTGRRLAESWPTPFPPGPHVAILQLAVRVYRASDVTFGILQTELGTAYTGRWLTPEVAMGLLGWRASWGVA
jgi:hypothetical protein